MSKAEAQGSIGGVEEIVSQLHARGVQSGREEAERIVARARLEAGEILREAEAERERVVGEGRREAERIAESARIEAEGMLESFMASLPDVFERRASELLDGLLGGVFDDDSSATIDQFIGSLTDDRQSRLARFFETATPQSFLEGLLVMAVAFYADADGFDHFTLDSRLRPLFTKLLAAPDVDPSVGYEFRDGISGFSIDGADGRRVVVSPECIKHMAQTWAGEEFRDVYVRLKTTGKEAGAAE